MSDADPLERAPECPSCNKPRNGPVCKHCGTNAHEVEKARCADCGTLVVQGNAKSKTTQYPLTSQWSTDYYCDDCW